MLPQSLAVPATPLLDAASAHLHKGKRDSFHG